MEKEEKFHTYPIEKFFRGEVNRCLKRTGVHNVEDLIDFPNLYYLLNGFSQKERQEFDREFLNLVEKFEFQQKFKKYSQQSIPKDSKDSLESILLEIISRLKKMENGKNFHLYQIENLFTREVSKLLKKSGFNSLRDLLDFDNIYNLSLLFPKKERQEFHREFTILYSVLILLEEKLLRHKKRKNEDEDQK